MEDAFMRETKLFLLFVNKLFAIGKYFISIPINAVYKWFFLFICIIIIRFGTVFGNGFKHNY